MKFSMQWLQKLVAVKTNAMQLAEKITNAGLEVESIENDIFDVSIPANRADCLGMVGLARDVAAVESLNFQEPNIAEVNVTINDKVDIFVKDSAACPKYLARIIKNVDNTKPTPAWIKQCLDNAGIKSISAVVDITNYVMLEWGQPLHAFDLQQIEGSIIVRKANSGESLQLLDESTVELTPNTLLIADNKKPLALAGIMGGKESGITSNTTDILLECAYFEPVAIRLTARQFGIKSDASYRFERCIDATMQEKVLERATSLIQEVAGGNSGLVSNFVDVAQLPKPVTITLRPERIAKILGISLSSEQITTILQNLGMQVSIVDSKNVQVVVPPFRPDITREIDLIEELVRIHGFAQIPAQATISTLDFKPQPESQLTEQKLVPCMASRGYNEVITYSFIDPEYAKYFASSINEELILSNPISSEMALMRPSLLPGLIKTVQYNQNRKQERLRLFEIGLRFVKDDKKLQQIKTLAAVCYGSYLPEGWNSPKRSVDFYDMKADIMALFKLAHNDADLSFEPTTDVAMHPGQCANIICNGNVIGKLGSLHPNLQQEFGLPSNVYMFEIDYASLVNGTVPSFKMFSKFPQVRRDLAILVSKQISAAQVEQAIKNVAGDLITDLVLFDLYQGKGIPTDQKSMALGITLQHLERTLTDSEVNEIFDNIITTLKREYNATLR